MESSRKAISQVPNSDLLNQTPCAPTAPSTSLSDPATPLHPLSCPLSPTWSYCPASYLILLLCLFCFKTLLSLQIMVPPWLSHLEKVKESQGLHWEVQPQKPEKGHQEGTGISAVITS